MKRIMRAFRISEISGVDRPAQAHAKAVIMKRDFSASRRRADAKSGAAESDGSFPIENATDLHNAMRAVGRSKNPAKTKAHIRARARALGLESQLSDAFKREDNGLLKALRFIKDFGVSKERLADSLVSIIEGDDGLNKAELAREMIDEFQDAVEGDLVKAVSEGDSDDSSVQGDHVSDAVKKALGLADTATEADVVAALAKRDEDLAKAKEMAEKAAKSESEAALAKAESEKADLAKRIAALEDEREMAAFAKKAEDMGLPASKGEMIRKAEGGDKAAWNEWCALFKSAMTADAKSLVYKELGATVGENSDDPVVMLKAKAAELRKVHPELSEQQAFARVYQDPANAELAKAERRKNGVA